MKYQVRQSVTEEQLKDSNLHIKEMINHNMFGRITHELEKNLAKHVIEKTFPEQGRTDFDLSLFIYGEQELKGKLKQIKKIMQHYKLDEKIQAEILHVFKDEDIESHKNNGKVYI